MNKVKTLDDLKKMRESLRASLDLREKSNTPDQLVQIKVSMATCGIAAGAKEIMSYFRPAENRCVGNSNRMHGLLLCGTDYRNQASGSGTVGIRLCR